MKKLLLTIVAMLTLGCACNAPQGGQSAPAPHEPLHAAPASAYGHLTPIQLPPGEFFDHFYVVPAVYTNAATKMEPEKYFYSCRPNTRTLQEFGHTFTLRDSQGIPVLVVRNPG